MKKNLPNLPSEGLNVEFKRQWSAGAKHTLSAFANTDGGTIYIGVEDDGEITGVEHPDQAMLQATQAAANAIRPDLMGFVSVTTERMDDRDVVVVQVQRGDRRPYYLTDKGISPAGVYIRSGAASIPASSSMILDMIRQTSGNSFEDAVSPNQDLDFAAMKNVFRQKNLELPDSAFRTLGLTNVDGLYTNLALLLSDQCPASVKAAKFQGESKAVFEHRMETSGSLFTQFEQLQQFLAPYNHVSSVIGPVYRQDFYDYPPETIREALLNLIVHRDYGYRDPALVSAFDGRVEFLNFGGLPKGITKRDIINGSTAQRNPKLAAVFYRLHIVEAYATGIPRIFNAYRNSPAQPSIDISEHTFKLTIPASQHPDKPQTATTSQTGIESDTEPTQPHEPVATTPTNVESPRTAVLPSLVAAPSQTATPPRVATTSHDDSILDFARSHGSITRAQVQALTGMPYASAFRALKRLVDSGTVERVGAGPKTAYRIKQ